ncbi:MAG: hypothetical protein HN368_12685, partial [Spirochaetales bacterium]|nr:hypothetical protein [Spirochaetales bacterium]
MNRNTCIIVGLCLLLASIVYADDGSWSNNFSINGGSIYAETDDANIVLEKEMLIFNGESTSVFFLFYNTSDKQISIDCGFPVINEIQTYKRFNHLEIPVGKYQDEGSIPAIEYFETAPLEHDDDDEPSFTFPEVILINDFNNSREFVEYEENMSGVSFEIYQDGAPVTIEKVLIDRQASADGTRVTFHFKHRLVFKPGQTSVVQVDYAQDLLFGNPGVMPGMSMYRWNYTIGTGSTWK